MNEQKKETILSVEERLKVIDDYDRLHRKPTAMAYNYNVSQSQIKGILQNERDTLMAHKKTPVAKMREASSIKYKLRNTLVLHDRVKVIQEYASKKPKPTFNQLAIKYNVSVGQITSILFNQDKIMRKYQNSVKDMPNVDAVYDAVLQLRQKNIVFLGRVMYEYIQRALYYNESLSEEIVQKKATEVKECIAIKNFRPTKTWLNDFKKTYGIEDFTLESLSTKITFTEVKRSRTDAVDMVRYVSDLEKKELQERQSLKRTLSGKNSAEPRKGQCIIRADAQKYALAAGNKTTSGNKTKENSLPSNIANHMSDDRVPRVVYELDDDEVQTEAANELRPKADDSEQMILKIETSPTHIDEDTDEPIVEYEIIDDDEEIPTNSKVLDQTSSFSAADLNDSSQKTESDDDSETLIMYEIIDDDADDDGSTNNPENRLNFPQTTDQIRVKQEKTTKDVHFNLKHSSGFLDNRQYSTEAVKIKLEVPDGNLNKPSNIGETAVASEFQKPIGTSSTNHIVIKTESTTGEDDETVCRSENASKDSSPISLQLTSKCQVITKIESKQMDIKMESDDYEFINVSPHKGLSHVPTTGSELSIEQRQISDTSTKDSNAFSFKIKLPAAGATNHIEAMSVDTAKNVNSQEAVLVVHQAPIPTTNKRQLPLSPLPDIDTVEEAIMHLKVLEDFAVLKENYRAIGLLTQLEDIFKKCMK